MVNEMMDDLIEKIREFMEEEGRACSMDMGCITPMYIYRMWGGKVELKEIEEAMLVIEKER